MLTKNDFRCVLLLAIVISCFCYESLLLGYSPYQGDISVQFSPWKSYVRAMLGDGEIPYWNPYTHGGAPFLANMQSAVFYPLDLLLFLFPLEQFFGLSLFLHLLLAGVGAYAFARICGASEYPALIAGIAYGLNGFTMIHIPAGNHYTYAGAAWAPWLFFATIGFIRCQGSRLPWGLAGALIACLHFLCGHPQMLFYSFFFSLVLCLVMGTWESRRQENGSMQVALIRTMAWGCFLSLGVLMAGMQFYPTLEYVLSASRSAALDLQAATEFSFAPHRLISLLLPEYYGTRLWDNWNHYDSFVYWSCAYAGIMIPFLAVALFMKGKKPITAIPLALVGLLALLLAWGRGNPVYAAIFHLPGFGHFRAPAKFLPYYLVPVCTLAALGVESLAQLAMQRNKEKEQDFTKRISMFLAVLVFVTVFLTPNIPWFYEILRKIPKQDFGKIRQFSFYIGFLLGLSSLAVYLYASKVPRYTREILSLSLAVVLVIDLFCYGRQYYKMPLLPPTQIQKYAVAPNELGIVRSPLTSHVPDRAVSLKDVYYADVFIQWKRLNIAGYDPLSLQAYNDQIGSMEGWEKGSFHDSMEIENFDHPVLDLLNVRYVATRAAIDKPGLQQVSSGLNFRVYERKSQHRMWAAAEVKDPTTHAIAWQKADEQIQWKQYRPHWIDFEYKTDTAIKMRVAEWFYPGWQAEAKIKSSAFQPIPVQRSTEGLRILSIPAGTEEIRMVYHAPVYGWLMAGAGWFFFILLLALNRVKHTDLFWVCMAKIMGKRE